MENIKLTIKSLANFLLEIVFPSKCIGCGKREEELCLDCADNIKRAERQTEHDIFAVYDYRDPLIKNIIWKLKYYNNKRLGVKLGELLYTSMLEDIQDIQTFSQGTTIYVIPVPISKYRKKNRGYNQSEIIAKSFCNSSELEILEFRNDIVVKKINTIPQAKLTNRNRRLQNIKGAFEIVNNKVIKNKTIIVVDDVTTTGGTILEIMKILKKAGAKKVVGFAVAH